MQMPVPMSSPRPLNTYRSFELAATGVGCRVSPTASDPGQHLHAAASGPGPPPLWPWLKSRFFTMCSRAGSAGASLSMTAPIRAPWCALTKAARAGGCCIRNLPSGIGWLGGFLLTRERVAGIEVVCLFWTAPSLTSEAGHRP
jgi:hypothetical protein